MFIVAECKKPGRRVNKGFVSKGHFSETINLCTWREITIIWSNQKPSLTIITLMIYLCVEICVFNGMVQFIPQNLNGTSKIPIWGGLEKDGFLKKVHLAGQKIYLLHSQQIFQWNDPPVVPMHMNAFWPAILPLLPPSKPVNQLFGTLLNPTTYV